MVRRPANICAFDWKAQDFALKGVDGKTHSLADVRGPKGTLVVFIWGTVSLVIHEPPPVVAAGEPENIVRRAIGWPNGLKSILRLPRRSTLLLRRAE
jgi:hypothetical protein